MLNSDMCVDDLRVIKPQTGDRIGWMDCFGRECFGTFLHTLPGNRVMVVQTMGSVFRPRVELKEWQLWSMAWDN